MKKNHLSWPFMCQHPAHGLALGFGSGLSPLAPGTAGTLWAWLVFELFAMQQVPVLWMGSGLLVAISVGWWACTITAQHLAATDPSSIVWDEIVAFWVVLWLITPADFGTQLWAFVLFRFFDAAKPGPIGWVDAAFKPQMQLGRAQRIGAWQGLGILLDDLAAALCTLLAMALWHARYG
jgi:phosphatidylglycerophosphatase A